VQKLTLRRTGAPQGDLGVMLHLGFMKSANQSGQDVGGLQIEIVARTIEVCGHKRHCVEAILLAIGFAGFDSGNFGDGVPLIGGFEGTGQEIVFLKRLRRKLRINARGAEEEQLLDLVAVSRVNNVALHG